MRWQFLVAIPLLASFTVVSSAQVYESCDRFGTTYDIASCLSRNLVIAQAQLKTTYERALASAKQFYEPQDVKNLQEAQKSWLAYREATCTAEYGLWGRGSGGPSAHTACLLRITKVRIEDLTEAFLLHDRK
jgi:uncharacterized protein YecT (DUF1311 family)